MSLTPPKNAAAIPGRPGYALAALLTVVLGTWPVTSRPNPPSPLADLEPERGTFCLDCLPAPYDLRVELTWKGDRDLDLHTLLPVTAEHVYYSDKNLPGSDLQSPGWLDHDHLTGPSPLVGERLLVTAPASPESPDPAARRYCLAVALYADRGGGAAADFTLFIDYRNRVHHRCSGRVPASGSLDQTAAFRKICGDGVGGSAERFSPPLLLVLPAPEESFADPLVGPGWQCEALP